AVSEWARVHRPTTVSSSWMASHTACSIRSLLAHHLPRLGDEVPTLASRAPSRLHSGAVAELVLGRLASGPHARRHAVPVLGLVEHHVASRHLVGDDPGVSESFGDVPEVRAW